MSENNVKRLREQMGLRQADLAQLVGVSGAYISMIENGGRTPTFDVARKMSDIFGCTVDYLLNNEGKAPDMEEYIVAIRMNDELRKIVDMLLWMPKEKLEKIIKLLEVWNE